MNFQRHSRSARRRISAAAAAVLLAAFVVGVFMSRDTSSVAQVAEQPIKSEQAGEPLGAAALPPGSPYIAAAGRSPIPQPGETIFRPFPYRPKAAASVPVAHPGEHAVVPWHQAGQYVGQVITIEGKIVAGRNTGSVCFLNFATEWRGLFYVIVFKEALDLWPQSPERHFMNQTVRVRGEVFEHRGQPQMRVTRADQIEIVTADNGK